MKYKIRIEILVPPKEGKTYESSETIYEQTTEIADILDVIKAVNGIVK